MPIVLEVCGDNEVDCFIREPGQTEDMKKLEIAELMANAQEIYEAEKNDIKSRASKETVANLEATFDHLHKTLKK